MDMKKLWKLTFVPAYFLVQSILPRYENSLPGTKFLCFPRHNQGSKLPHPCSKHCVRVIEILLLERVCLRWSCKHVGQINLVNSLLIYTLDKVIYYIGTFYRVQQNLSLLHKIGWRSAEKTAVCFFNKLLLV
jgi:hypothetical protein